SKGALTGVTIREDGMVVDKFGKNVVNVDQLEFDKNGNVVVKGEDKTPNNGGSKIDDATKIDVVKPINRDDKNINVRERQKITTSAIDKAAAEAGVVAKTVGDKTVFIKDNKVVAEGKVVDGQFVINGRSENDINIAIDGNGNANINGE
ncbi:hypothetical protein AB4189_25545, partial [Vibrio sp. 10N.286.49.E1]|uniref:hypothetical protein n=1 Tax=Vibrio sp. 10N.286.49.E1 TaxID=3229702 RepID=UPI0035540E92